jgi:hypothetical protein
MMSKTMVELKGHVSRQAWETLDEYFTKGGNGPKAKIACIVIGTLAREEQAKNNARQIDIIEVRLGMDKKNLLKPGEI